MDLATLSSLSEAFKHSAQNKNEQRIQEAQNYYWLGLYGLVLLEKQAFQDKALAKQLSQTLLKAIQLYRKAPEPYVALAYLLMAYGQSARALRYLQTALELDSQQPDAQKLMALLKGQSFTVQRMLRVEEILAQPAFLHAHWRTKYTGIQKMQALLERIHSHVEELEQQQSFFQPSSETEQIETLEYHLDEMDELQHLIEVCLHQVKEPALLKGLHLRLGSLVKLRQKMNQLLKTSHTLADLHDEIEDLSEQVRMALEDLEIPERRTEIQTNLDRWFFRCDQFANQLEELETHPYNLQAMFRDYEDLTAALVRLEASLPPTNTP